VSDAVLREATRDDDEGIRACLAESFPDNPKARADVLAWQYWDNPFGETASWVWDDGGEIVGHYANYPAPCLLDGRPSLAGLAVDAAMSPKLQGKRMFRPLAEALYEGSADKGMAVSLAYPSNPIAVKGIVSAGWLEVARLRTLVLATDETFVASRFKVPAPVVRAGLRVAFGPGQGPSGAEVGGPPEGLDDLWATWAATGRIRNGIVRAAAWWDWRYARSPMGPYRYFEVRAGSSLLAAAVVVVHEDFGGRFAYLLELLAEDRDAGRALLRTIVRWVDGVAGLAAVAVQGSHLHRIARASGMRTLPRRLEPKGLWFGFVDNGARGWSRLRTAPWAIQWGDLDHL
jgi:hypothetical protein